MSWSQNEKTLTPAQKQTLFSSTDTNLDLTIIKNPTIRPSLPSNTFDAKTPQASQAHPKRAIVFLGNNRSKHMFPLYRDEEIGIKGDLQRIVHHSGHDDDKMTSTTQLGLAISQTCEDLYEVVNWGQPSNASSPSSYTQGYSRQSDMQWSLN